MDQTYENEVMTPDSADALSPTFERTQTLRETKRRLFLSKLKTISIYKSPLRRSWNEAEEGKEGFFTKRFHSNSADFSKKLGHKKTRSSEFGKQKTKEPKIIITLARDDIEHKKTTENGHNELKAGANDEIQSPLIEYSPTKSHIPGIFRKRSTRVSDFVTTTAQIRHRQSLTRSTSLKITKNETGKLLNIIANQALFGKQSDVSRTFFEALKKVNEKALERARKDHNKKKRHRISWYFRKVRLLFKRIFRPLKPDSGLIIAWKIMILAVIVVQCILSTYILSFLPDEQLDYSTSIVLADLIFDVIYFFDILLNFRTAFYHRGELCMDSSKIASNYLHSFFAFDLLSLISIFGLASVDHAYKPFILFDLLRIINIPRITTKIQDYFQFPRQISSLFQLFRLCCAIVVFAHWWACCLYAISLDDPDPNSWIIEAGLSTKPIQDIYVASLYWSIATMATIGYGDIHPVTYRERILSIVIMIASSIIFGYILSSIGSLMTEIGAFNSESREKMRLLTKYMSDKGLNKDIQTKIRKYLEFYLDKENTMKMEGDNILQLLSFNLKEEIIKEVNFKILGDTYMFSSNFRKKFLYLISKDLVEKALAPDEMIITHGDCSDGSIYFVTSGAVEIIYEKCTVSVQRLAKGETFGFLAFFADRPRTASVKSVEFSTVFQLKREKFLERLEDFPTEKETYCMIKDSINLYENYQYLNLSCYSCGSKNHITLHCPRFHFTSNKQQIIGRYLLEERRFNRDFKRSGKRRFHAYGNIEVIQEAALQIQVIQQNELHYQSMVTEKVDIYSEGEDILDKNIYNPQPMTYTVEPMQIRAIDVPIKILTTLPSIHLSKEASKKRILTDSGDVQTFVHCNYDPYYHNVNLDKVKSFEVYYPNNNITKLLVEFERVRLEKIVQMRLGVSAKHISPLLVKSFKMNERIKTRDKPSAGIVSAEGSVLSNGTMSPTGRRHVNKNISMINPSDITFYSSIKKNSIDFAVHQSGDLIGEKRPNTLAFVGSTGARDGPGPKVAHSLLEQDEWGRYVQRNVASARDADEIPQERYMRPQQRGYSPGKRSSDVRLSLFSQENMRLGQHSSNSRSSSDSDSESDTFNVFTAKADPSGGSHKKKTSRDRASKDKSYPEKSRNLLETSRVPQSLMLSDNSIEGGGAGGSKGSSDMGKLRISQFKFNSGANMVASDNEDVNSPVDPPFDFTNQMKKLSKKLEENRSPLRPRKTSSSMLKSPPKQGRGSLARMMIKERNMKLRKDSKGRSASEDQERKAEKVIEEFGLLNIVKREFGK